MVFLLLGFLMWPVFSWAQQVDFSLLNRADSVHFSYRWRDVGHQIQALQFDLPVDDLQRGSKEFKPFDNDAANVYAYQMAEAKAKALSVGGVSFQIIPKGRGYELTGKAPAGVALDPLAKQVDLVRQKAMDDYVRQAFYTTVGGDVIMPDHKRIAARYSPALLPVEQAIFARTRAMPLRDRINWMLGFLQTIPYDQLVNRQTSNGAGFQTPYGLFLGNRGDCDTKAVALAALIHGLHPELRLAMIYVPEHAFLGIGLPRDRRDYALELGGQVFVLADPTGPELLRLGDVARFALADLNRGQYSYQEIVF